MKKYIYSAAALMTLSMLTLTSCQNEMEQLGSPAGKEVLLRVTASRGDAATRTSLENDGNGGLTCNWNEGDQLLVVNNSNGSKLGVLTIVKGFDTPNGTFEGNVNLEGQDAISLVYLGTAGKAETYTANSMEINLSAQNGSFASLTDQDVLTAEAKVDDQNFLPTGNTVETSVTMTRQLAFGYFTLDFGEDVTLAAGDVITISGEGLKSEGKVNFKNGGSIPTVTNYSGSTTITVTKKEAGNDFYITMLPFGDVTPTFTVVKGSDTYTATLGAHNWVRGEYVRAYNNGNESGVSVEMKKDGGVDDTDNPGNLNNWPDPTGSGVGESWNILAKSNREFSKNGRYTNCLDLRGYGGWATYVEIKNGIKTNLLTSYGGSAFYFQWGRIMGFPSNITSEPNMPIQYDNSYGEAGKLGYYDFHYETDYTNWGYTDSNKYPYVFSLSQAASKTLDWYSANPNATWEACSGNPCPDGYRLPTATELSVFEPEGYIIDGSLVQYKTISGVRYAIEWVVTEKSGSTPAYITVRSAQTNRTDVKVGDAIFADSNAVKLTTYGYIQLYPYSLRNTASFVNKGSQGIYWSSDVANAGDAFDSSLGISGNGGKALYIEVSGTKAAIKMRGFPKTFGGCVMPIKDGSASGQSYRPWFPYANTWF